jgi:hypothetical protein
MDYSLLPEDERTRVDAPNDRLNVCKQQCKHCLFGKKPLVPWEPIGRQKVELALKEDSSFKCHQFQNSMCSAYWHRHGKYQWFGKLALTMDAIRWIE